MEDTRRDCWKSYAASVVQSINSVGVPCILWGHCLLNVHGIPSIIGSIDFVIPNEGLAVSSKQLSGIHCLESCTDWDSCPCSSQERPTPPPAFHAHIKDSDVTVGLYLQTETLWFLPPLDGKLALPVEHILPEYLVLASDQTVLPPWRPGRGSGVFTPEQGDRVIVPKSHVLLEAFLRLYARDSGTRMGSFGMAMIGYMEQYVDEDGYLDAQALPMPLRIHYLDLREGTTPVRQWTKDLRHSLGIPEVESDDE